MSFSFNPLAPDFVPSWMSNSQPAPILAALVPAPVVPAAQSHPNPSAQAILPPTTQAVSSSTTSTLDPTAPDFVPETIQPRPSTNAFSFDPATPDFVPTPTNGSTTSSTADGTQPDPDTATTGNTDADSIGTSDQEPISAPFVPGETYSWDDASGTYKKMFKYDPKAAQFIAGDAHHFTKDIVTVKPKFELRSDAIDFVPGATKHFARVNISWNDAPVVIAMKQRHAALYLDDPDYSPEMAYSDNTCRDFVVRLNAGAYNFAPGAQVHLTRASYLEKWREVVAASTQTGMWRPRKRLVGFVTKFVPGKWAHFKYNAKAPDFVPQRKLNPNAITFVPAGQKNMLQLIGPIDTYAKKKQRANKVVAVHPTPDAVASCAIRTITPVVTLIDRLFVGTLFAAPTLVASLIYNALHNSCRLVVKRLSGTAKLFVPGAKRHFTKQHQFNPEAAMFVPASRFNPLATTFVPQALQDTLALVQVVDPFAVALASKVQLRSSISVVSILDDTARVQPMEQTIQYPTSCLGFSMVQRKTFKALPLLCMLMSAYREQVLNAVLAHVAAAQGNLEQEDIPERSEDEFDFYEGRSDHNTEGNEADEYDPSQPLILVRPSSSTSDDWERETIFPEQDDTEEDSSYTPPLVVHSDQCRTVTMPTIEQSLPTGTVMLSRAIIIKHDAARSLFRSVRPFQGNKQVARIDQTGFGPSVTQIHQDGIKAKADLEQQLAILTDKSADDKPYHHISFLGYGAPCKSATAPALSLAIINTMPKAAMSPDDASRHLHDFTRLREAYQFVCPVIHAGSHATIQGLSTGEIYNAATGLTTKFYQGYGTWMQDSYDLDEDEPDEDAGMPELYPDDHTVYNGYIGTSRQQDQHSFHQFVAVAYSMHKEERQEAYLLRKTNFPVKFLVQNGEHLIEQLAPAGTVAVSSPLWKVYTPESMSAEEQDDSTTRDLIRPSCIPWADLDEEEYNQEQRLELLLGIGGTLEPECNPYARIELEEGRIPGLDLISQKNDSMSEDESKSQSSSLRSQLDIAPVEHQESTEIEDDSVFLSDDDAELITAAKADADDIPDEQLFGMTFKEEFELLHGKPMPETPSAKISPKSSSEEYSSDSSPEDKENEEMSPVTTPEVRRIVSDSTTPLTKMTADDVDVPNSCLPETPESVKRIAMRPRSASAPGINDAAIAFKLPSEPKLGLPRSQSFMDLANKYNEGNLKQTKADKAVSALSEIVEEDEELFEKALEYDQPPKKSLTDINKGYRQFHGLPEPGQKSLREEYDINDVDLVSSDIKIPTTARRYREARAKVNVMPAIADSPGPIVDEDEDLEQDVAATCAVASDDGSEIGEAVVHDTYTASSVPLSSSPPSSSRWAGSSIFDGIVEETIDQSQFANFSGIHNWDEIEPRRWGFSGIHIVDLPPQSEVAVYSSPYTSPDDVSFAMPGAYPSTFTPTSRYVTSRQQRSSGRVASWFGKQTTRKASASSQASAITAHGQMSSTTPAAATTSNTRSGFFGSIRDMFKGSARHRS